MTDHHFDLFADVDIDEHKTHEHKNNINININDHIANKNNDKMFDFEPQSAEDKISHTLQYPNEYDINKIKSVVDEHFGSRELLFITVYYNMERLYYNSIYFTLCILT